MSKIYKVRIVATKTMWVTQEDLNEDANSCGFIAEPHIELDEQSAIDFAKGTLIHELQDNPNRGSAEIISIYDTETKELKTKIKYLK